MRKIIVFLLLIIAFYNLSILNRVIGIGCPTPGAGRCSLSPSVCGYKCGFSGCGGGNCAVDQRYVTISGSGLSCCASSTSGCENFANCIAPTPTPTPGGGGGGGSCNSYGYISGSAPASINVGTTTSTGAVVCNYGGQYDCINPVLNSANPSSPWSGCSWVGYTGGNNATFTCTAVSTPGTYANICETRTGTTGNCCASSNNSGAVTIPPPNNCPTIVSALPASATVGTATNFSITYSHLQGANLIDRGYFGFTPATSCSNSTGEAGCSNFERQLAQSLIVFEARGWGGIGAIGTGDSCSGGYGGTCPWEYFPTVPLPNNNANGTATVNSVSASDVGYNRTVIWNVTLGNNFLPGTYNYYAMAKDTSGNYQSCGIAKWDKLTQVTVNAATLTSTPVPTATPVPPTATTVPGCLCNTDSTCETVCGFDKFPLPITYANPIKCSLFDSLFSTPPTDKNVWCQRNMRTKGDADGDGVIGTTDYLYYVATVNGGKIPVSANPDFNGDGEIGIADREIIIKSLNPSSITID